MVEDEHLVSEGALTLLQKRSHGGEDVAVRPDVGDEAFWPRGPMLPGVHEMLENAVARADNADGLNLYFLLGGAGNGKSFAARELSKRLGLVPQASASGLALRAYEQDRMGARVVLLNDATIAPQADYPESQEHALAADLERWWRAADEQALVGFCCVNRGIVVDELRSLVGLGEDRVGAVTRAVLQWLIDHHSGHIDAFASGEDLGSPEKMKVPGDDYHSKVMVIDGRPLRLFALAVDSSSLVSTSGSTSPAGDLLVEVLKKCRADAAGRPACCPIRSNFDQLAQEGAADRWAGLLAAAEIAAGRMFSYRDLWGLIALSLVGPRAVDSGVGNSNVQVVDALLAKIAAGATAGDRIWHRLMLSRFRLGICLFRAPVPSAHGAQPDFPASTPYDTGFTLLDPASWGSADALTIEEAMTSIALGENPSEKLGTLLQGCWSEFDAALESDLVEYCQLDSCPDAVRRRLIAWYSGYLSRLAALSTGNLGNEAALKAWGDIRKATSSGAAPLPSDLEVPIRALLFPQATGDHAQNLLVTAFAPRAEPVTGSWFDRPPTLVEVISHAPVALRARRVAGRLVLECVEAGSEKVLGQLILDFAVVRDVIAWRGRRAGQTESTTFVEPRLERCRASTIAALPSSHRKLAALIGDQLAEIYQ